MKLSPLILAAIDQRIEWLEMCLRLEELEEGEMKELEDLYELARYKSVEVVKA